MKNFTDIQNRLRDLYASRYEPDGVRVLADIYWRILLACASLVVIFAIFWGMWDLFDVFGVLAGASDTTPLPPPALNRTKLDVLVQGFAARETQFTDLSANPPAAIPDPSR